MKDKDKTQKQPTKEVAQLRRRIAELEKKNTERKQAEEALRESEEKYRTILEKIEDGYYEVDLNGNFTFFNDSMCRILRYPQEEMMGMNNRQFTDKEYAKKLFKTFNEVYRTGEPAKEFDWQIIRKDGTKRYIEVSISLQKNSSGKPIGFRGIARDVTERKQAEAALHESEQRYRGLFEGTAEGILIADLKSKKFLYANPSICNMLGYSLEEFRNLSVRDIHPSESLEYVISEFEAQARGEKSLALAIPCLRKNGTIVYADIVTSKILIDNKEFNVGFFTDITERKQAERRLRESEEKYRDLVENINDILYTTDENGVITYIASAIELFSGYAPSEIIGRPFSKFVYQEDAPHIMDKFQEIVSGNAEAHEYRMVTKSGVVRWVRTSSRPFFEGTRLIGLNGILIDITERKQAEEEVKRSYEQLHETLISTVNALASTVEMRDRYTAGHQPRVTQLACAIAEKMGLPAEQIEGIRMASSLHDIGKIMIPAEILNKPGPLTELQFEMIKMHPQAGYDILKGIKFPWPVAEIVLQHHERLDGSGYPQGLSGEEIMVEARILIVANVVEAMTSHRLYRPATDIKEALAEISKGRWILYDPTVVDACVRLCAEKAFAFF